jgi:dTDP-4-amino-4,6-dideoxygalactose transaminase
MDPLIPFNRPPEAGREIELIRDAIARQQIAGGGYYTKASETWLEQMLQVPRALLVHSCTAALEMATLLANLAPGDEVIMPSFTFVSTANAVALRGAVPVFVDVRPDTLNIDEKLIEAAVGPRTRAIIVVHYAGVCAEMDTVREIAARHRLLVIEDAAHALMSEYRGRLAGTLGDLACFSFHETKNVVSGEGGALIVNRRDLIEAAEVIRDKGTNRARFLQGLVDKYSWVSLGSSYVPSEIVAAFLRAQLDAVDRFTADRMQTWNYYHDAFADVEARGLARRPHVPSYTRHNGHLYYLVLPSHDIRNRLIAALRHDNVQAIFHYVPLHSSEAGRRYGRSAGSLPVTEDLSVRLLRLPVWYGMGARCQRVVDRVLAQFVALSL